MIYCLWISLFLEQYPGNAGPSCHGIAMTAFTGKGTGFYKGFY
jgi:hypothetical protein